jgi:riboflavin biosynthesis pyrimidine reductase
MSQTVLRLYPPPYEAVPVRGLYLALGLHNRGTAARPFVYANFLASLDGRIAVEDADGIPRLPKTLTSPTDFRLFLELHAQADCLITHGGYLRSLAAGRLGNILQVGHHDLGRDLAEWRRAQGLPPQPAIVIASAGLDFPMPASIREHGQPCCIATGEKADPRRVEHWREQGYEVIFAGGDSRVDGEALTQTLGGLGYRTLYLIAGPEMLDTMARNGRLAGLFQTITHQLLGGERFRTILSGPELGPLGHLKVKSLYYDPGTPEGAGQWIAQFEAGAGRARDNTP